MTLKHRFPKLFGQLLFLFTALVMAMGLFSYGSQPAAAQAKAKYVILFIGDGMGQEHVEAGGYFNDTPGALYFESFPRKTLLYHNNARNCTTDSAASGTAIATGVKVNQGVISWKPDGTNELKTLLEIYKEAGMRTGLVTTSYVTDATPSAFGAHNSSRENRTDIFDDYLYHSQPNVLFGAVGKDKGVDITLANADGSPYSDHVATNKAQMAALTGTQHAAGFFGSGESVLEPEGIANRPATLPTLPEMTAKALDLLDNEQGFFLLVEHEGTDQWSHLHYAADANATANERVVRTVVELAKAVETAETWLTTKGYMDEALLLVTADHETGGLSVTDNPDSFLPNMIWRSSASSSEEAAHTQEAVPLYAKGLGADQITPGLPLQNNNLFTILHPTERLGLVNSAPVAGSIDYCIWDRADDAEEKIFNGNVLLNDLQLDLGAFINQNGGRASQAVGLRFRDLNLPPQAAIHSAYLEFEVAAAGNEATNLTISAEYPNDALRFTTTNKNITTRTLTTANIAWQINSSWDQNQVVRSPDLKNVLQEVVNHNDWQRLDDIVLVINRSASSTGSRVVGAFENDLWAVPKLHIEYGDWHGSISIVESASPADNSGFTYSSAQLGNFTLADPGSKTQVFSELSAGTYHLSHALPWPWYVDIWCSSDQGKQVQIDTSDTQNLALTINLNLGENVSCTFEHTRFTPPLRPPGEGELYLSTGMAGTAGNVPYAAGDLLFLDSANGWYKFPLYSDVNGIAAVRYGGACFAFSVPKVLVGTDPDGVTPQDVACWNPIFPNGYFELWFDGSDVGLDEGGEAIDALYLFKEGEMLISTQDDFSVDNDTITGQDHDILRFKFSNWGENTQGTWSVELDGSTVSGMEAEDITGLWVDEETGDLYLSFEDAFTIKGVGGSANDVLRLHKNNNVWSASLAWIGANHGFSGKVRGLEMGPVPHQGLEIGRRPPKP